MSGSNMGCSEKLEEFPEASSLISPNDSAIIQVLPDFVKSSVSGAQAKIVEQCMLLKPKEELGSCLTAMVSERNSSELEEFPEASSLISPNSSATIQVLPDFDTKSSVSRAQAKILEQCTLTEPKEEVASCSAAMISERNSSDSDKSFVLSNNVIIFDCHQNASNKPDAQVTVAESSNSSSHGFLQECSTTIKDTTCSTNSLMQKQTVRFPVNNVMIYLAPNRLLSANRSQQIPNVSANISTMSMPTVDVLRQSSSQHALNNTAYQGISVNNSVSLQSCPRALVIAASPPLQSPTDRRSAHSLSNESNLFKCPHCPMVLFRLNDYNQHLWTHKKAFTCNKCEMTFWNKRSLRDHSLSHNADGSNPLKCQLCDKVLSTLNALSRHTLIHSSEKPFECENCGERYRSASQLQRHSVSHSDDRRKFKCELCSLAFGIEIDLQKHVRRRHSEKPRPMFMCPHCSKMFARKPRLLEHIKIHEGVGDVYRCEDCSKIFNGRQNLLNHILYMHVQEKLYKCQECEKWFAARHRLNAHVKLVHCEQPRQRRFKCEDCSKMFYTKHALKEHMNVHLNVKPFTCDVCGKSFTREMNLKQHVVIHSGLKPFKCNLCDKAFSWRSHLNSHLRGHQGLKLHQCEQCGKSFSERSGLRLHMRSYHQTELPYTNNQLRN